MNLLTVARSATAPADLGWSQDWRDPDAPAEALSLVLDSAWHAVSAMRGTEVVAAASTLRQAFLQKERFGDDFPCDEVETLLALGSLWGDDIDEAVRRAQSVFNDAAAEANVAIVEHGRLPRCDSPLGVGEM